MKGICCFCFYKHHTRVIMELGSEYNLSLSELTIQENNIFSYLAEFKNRFYFDSGRSALKHLARQLDRSTKILLPEFICESVTNCFNGLDIAFYRLKKDFTVDTEDLAKKANSLPNIIFLMHYFGSLQPKCTLEAIRDIAQKNNSLIIEDTTHSIFSEKNTIGDYNICSIRKWLPIPGGGVLYYNDDKLGLSMPNYLKSTDNYRSYGMILKELFLNSGFFCNEEYRKIFIDSENQLDQQEEIYEISDFAAFIATCIDVEKIISKRKHNYETLYNELTKTRIRPAIGMGPSDVPLVLPIRVHNRNVLRSYLIDKQIYCAVHWPFDYLCTEQRPFAIKNSEELISLPIDQRYGEEHMQYLVDVLKNYGGDLLF